MQDYQDRLRIATPEGVSVDLVLAGIGSRCTATLIDLIFKSALWIGAFFAGALLGDLGIAFASIASFCVYFGYDVVFEVLSGGRTPGKRWNGLRVLRADGRPVDLLSSAIRNVVRLVDGLPFLYLPAMVSILATRRNQRLGDLAAATIVVREPRRREPVTAPAPATFQGFAPPPTFTPRDASAPLDVTAVTPDDLAAVRSFLERRGDLPPLVREDLARRMAGALAPRLGGATGHLRPEELLERVVAEKQRSG
jgi:uncharacterized RDD family membrane protein YckC